MNHFSEKSHLMGNRGVMTPDNLQRNTNKILAVIFHPHIS